MAVSVIFSLFTGKPLDRGDFSLEVDMAANQLLLRPALIAGGAIAGCGDAVTEPMEQRTVRIAELEIEPTQLERYKIALKEEIETSIRVEPGVLSLNAVSIKGHPTQIRIFETYADMTSY